MRTTRVDRTARAVAALVVSARTTRGWSQSRLAVELGTTQSAVARIESGRRPVAVATLVRLADALAVTFTIGPEEAER